MKTRLYLGAALGAALWLTPFWLTPVQAQDKSGSGPPVNVTGCVAQGEKRNQFTIKDASGKSYDLSAGSELNLKAHVGHKMTITGTPMAEKKAKAGKAEGSERLRVSNFSMVSTSCS